ncbi:arrestin domain-containing protein 3-like [Pseudorasbora parva]|uniref:arrestin domain-containing protein 3-like n=1 Tax=Pseudorasbora parva TaxID=51549 RepID=UPI00351DDCE6
MSGSIKVLGLYYNKINESNTFTSGDIVEGHVVLEVTKEIVVDHFFVKLKGDAKVRWPDPSSDSNRTYRDHERYFKLKQYFIQESLKKGEQERSTTRVSGETYGPVIKKGRHVFPFRFRLPQKNIPASFEGVHGSVKYVLMVKLKRHRKPTSSTCRELTVLPRNDRTHEFLMLPQYVIREKKMRLFSSGKISLAVTTDKTGYMQGETIKNVVDIDNSSSHDVKPMYSLQQQQTFMAGKETKIKSKNIVHETKDCVPSGGKHNFIVNLKLPRYLPVTIENCRILKVQYYLKVSLDVSFATDPEIMLPVVILPADQQCPPCQGPSGGFQPYPPPQPNLVPYPGGQPPPYAELYPNAMLPGFYPTPSAPVYDPNQSTKF